MTDAWLDKELKDHKSRKEHYKFKKEEDIYTEINKNPEPLETLLNAELKEPFPKIDNVLDVPDYLFIEKTTAIPVYLEIKKWFLRITDVHQLIKYYIHLKEHGKLFKLVILCEGLDPIRKDILDKLGIRVLLLNEIPFEVTTKK